MPATLLSDRAVVDVSGAEARAFLQGLVTCNMDAVSPTSACFGALLTPQGKIITDFIISEQGNSFYLDTPQALVGDLVKRLRLYKLRAQIEITERADLAVGAFWGESSGIADPRDKNLPWRLIAPRAQVEALGLNEAAYEALRVSAGVPKGGVDFAYGDAFPHDVNMDLIGGVDFRKGCYVGQEVVSRVQHRGTARAACRAAIV
jgi:folate-binding protein YgfZ